MYDFTSPLQVARDIVKAKRTLTGSAYTEIAKASRVEPIVITDARVVGLDYFPDVLNSLLNRFTAYYLQAFIFSEMNINGVEVIKMLDALNPDRDSATALMDAVEKFSKESLNLSDSTYGLGLLNKQSAYKQPTGYLETEYKVSVENEKLNEALRFQSDKIKALKEELDAVKNVTNAAAQVGNKEAKIKQLTSTIKEMEAERDQNSTGYDAKTFKDRADMGMGKLLNLTVKHKGQTYPIPITVRMIPSVTAPLVVKAILALTAEDRSFVTRIKMWRAGQLRAIQDLILVSDVIEKERKVMMKDDKGIYKALQNRQQGNVVAAAASGRVSIGAASNIIIMSSLTAKEFEREQGISFSDFTSRQRIFNDTYAILICVIDVDYNAITIYDRDLDVATDLTSRELRNATRDGKGSEVLDILRDYTKAGGSSLSQL